MSGTSELFAGPEQAPQPLTVLHDTVQHCFADPHNPSVLMAQRELFQEIVQQGVSTQTDAYAQRAIEAYGELIDYLWFQPTDAPLPEAVVLEDTQHYSQRYGEFALALGYLGPTAFDDITKLLRRLGLGRLLQLRAENLERNKTALLQAIEVFGATTSSGQWLQQFNAQHGQQPTRLTPLERGLREARITGAAAQLARRQHALPLISSGAIRATPGAVPFIKRQSYPLDEELGRRLQPHKTPKAAEKLAYFATKQLMVTRSRRAKPPAQLQYDSAQEELRFINARNRTTRRYNAGEISLLLHDLYNFAPTLGADDLSADLFGNALHLAFKSTLSQEAPSDVYASALKMVAAHRVSKLESSFALLNSGFVLNGLDFLKQPPRSTLFGYGLDAYEDEEHTLHLQHPPDVIVGEEESTLEDLERFEQRERAISESKVRIYSPVEEIAFAYEGLLGEARQFLSLPPDTPMEKLYTALKALGESDPVVSCLGLLAQAQVDLAQGGELTRARSGEACWQLHYVERLEALGSQAGMPENGYVALPHLAAALRRALGPIIKLIAAEKPPHSSA